MQHIPNQTGLIHLKEIPLKSIYPYIHWSFFFMAWRLTGKFEGIESTLHCVSCKMSWLHSFPEEQRPKAEEAAKLYKDAQDMLQDFVDRGTIKINAAVGIYPSIADENDNIIFNPGEKQIIIPTLRQQRPSTDGFCYSLSDFIKPQDDYCGVFATTVQGGEELSDDYEKEGDMYNSILIKTLCDRIAEASAEWLHYQVRKNYWGYAPNEKEDIEAMYKCHYEGIRPAIGYPSLPDQSIIFDLQSLIDFKSIGIELTENGAMYPNASVSGLYFAHPKSKYFMIGKIDDQQLEDYANRRSRNKEEMKKWLAANL